MTKSWSCVCACLVLLVVAVASVRTQTTEFVYQGQLQNASVPANGNFDFEFLLFDALSGGSQVGATLTKSNVAVANGIFSVSLDFGGSFPGTSRFLEIHTRQTGGGAFTPLAPRQSVSSAPYAIRASTVTGPVTGANAAQTLLVTNSQPGITDPSPTHLPPAALRSEATATNDSNAGLIGIGDGTTGIGVIGVSAGIAPVGGKVANAIGVLGLATAASGKSIGVGGQVFSPDGIAVQAQSTSGIAVQAQATTGRLFVGSNDAGGDVFTVDAAGALNIGQGKFTVDANGSVTSLGTVNLDGNRFTVDANGNAVVAGTLSAMLPGGGGSSTVCVVGANLRVCSSSLRYKKQVNAFTGGLDLVKRLQPITFKWRENDVNDLGFGAEDVAKVEPLLTFQNAKGEVEGVKYAQINVVLVNAIKEQQKQIDEQSEVIKKQRADLDDLKAIVCSQNPTAVACKPQN